MRRSLLLNTGKGKYRALLEGDDVVSERWLDLGVRRERPGLYEVAVDSRCFQVKRGLASISPEDSQSLKTYRLVDGWQVWEREPFFDWSPIRSDYRDDGAWNHLKGALIGICHQVAKDQAFDKKAREEFVPQVTEEGRPVDRERLLLWLRRRRDHINKQIKSVNHFACERNLGQLEVDIDAALQHLISARDAILGAINHARSGRPL